MKPYTHNNNENICPTICAFEHGMWNAERICWILMSENCDNGVIIRKKQINLLQKKIITTQKILKL